MLSFSLDLLITLLIVRIRNADIIKFTGLIVGRRIMDCVIQRRELYSEELHQLYSSHCIIVMFRSENN
jgi:hypothetical protein